MSEKPDSNEHHVANKNNQSGSSLFINHAMDNLVRFGSLHSGCIEPVSTVAVINGTMPVIRLIDIRVQNTGWGLDFQSF